MDRQLLSALKALSDASRLRILGLLAGGRRMSVPELADVLGMSPGAVHHHLERLRDADLVAVHPSVPHVVHELRLDRLAAIGAGLDQLDRTAGAADAVDPMRPGPSGDVPSGFEAKVLRAFLVDGRLEVIPAQHRKRQVILRFLARTDFRPGEDLPEKEVNMRLALRHPDVASLRRYLVENGYMTRSGGIYQLLPEGLWPSPETTAGD